MKNITIILMVMFVAMSASAKAVDPSAPILYKGMASWYSEQDVAILETTANMEKFDDSNLTCAIWDLPFNTIIKVTNLKNGKTVFVRVNDRGPAKRLVKEGRVIDLTKAAFSKISELEEGLIDVKIEIM